MASSKMSMNMLAGRPIAAALFTYTGGMLITFVGAILTVIGSVTAPLLSQFPEFYQPFGLLGGLSVILGLLIMITAGIMLIAPGKNGAKTWGILALIFSILAIFNGGGALVIISFLFVLTGTILAFTYKG